MEWHKVEDYPVGSEELNRRNKLKYREAVVQELRNHGATDEEIELLTEQTIQNALDKNRDPADVAWALLQ